MREPLGLAESPLLAACAGLDLPYTAFTDGHLLTLARAGLLDRLHVLDLSNTRVTLQGVVEALRQTAFTNLRRLSLRGMGPLTGDQFREFVESPLLPRLTHLDLLGNSVPAGATALLLAAPLERMVELRISYWTLDGPHRQVLVERLGRRLVVT